MDAPTLIVIALAALIVGSYLLGTSVNRGRTQEIVTALRSVLPRDGTGGLERLGRSVVRMSGRGPAPGIGHVTATALLTPREAVFAWAMWAIQRRGDLVDLRVDLDRPPSGAGLLCDPGHRLGRAALRAGLAAGGTASEVPGGLTAVSYDAGGLATMRRAAAVVAEAGSQVVLLELRAAQPRLDLVLRPGAGARNVASLPSMLARISREVTVPERP